MSADNDTHIPEPHFGDPEQFEEKEVTPSEEPAKKTARQAEVEEDDDDDDIPKKASGKKKRTDTSEKKESMSIFKMTLIAMGVSAGLFVVGFGLMAGLSPSKSDSVLPEESIDQSQAAVEEAFPEHPAPVAQIQPKNDEFAGVANELGGIGGSPVQNDLPLPKGVAPANFDPANYVTVAQYRILQTQISELSSRLKEYEKNGGSGRGNISSGAITGKLANIEQRLGNVESYLETVKTSLSAVEEVVAQKKKEIFEREGNIRTDVPESAKGRSRLVGYQYAMGTENKDVAIVIDGKGEMTVLTTGVNIDYQGQSIAVNKVLDQENIVLLGDKYFIDKTKGIGPAGQAAQTAMKVKAVSPTPRSERNASKAVGVKKISGWRVLAATPDPAGGYEATVETPSGTLITLKRGERVKVYGQVAKVTETNVYFNGYMF
ncbi:TPA: hypothetical protein ACSCYS_003642 [Aeromonas veronii]|nr:hypothetical protein [Aeromonas veronii]